MFAIAAFSKREDNKTTLSYVKANDLSINNLLKTKHVSLFTEKCKRIYFEEGRLPLYIHKTIGGIP